MPQVEVEIGGRTFEVACQEGEEAFLHAAAAMLNVEATALTDQMGRMPETGMLLMSGPMLAGRTAALEDKLKESETREAELRARIERLEAAPPPEAENVEVPVIPSQVTETLAEIAARAESLAQEVESRTGGLIAATNA